MRIKCPNSDIFLELPGDRTDMKFTCPACHKVHRVTVTISTPGEEPPKPAGNTRSVSRPQQQIPKKYATGAYAPVVDIPIDANFVLVDANAPSQQGIDLGIAAAPPAGDFSTRKTEIIDRRDAEKRAAPPRPEPIPMPTADSEETALDDDRHADERSLWSKSGRTMAPPAPPPPSAPPPPAPTPTPPPAPTPGWDKPAASQPEQPATAESGAARSQDPERRRRSATEFRDPEANWNDDLPSGKEKDKDGEKEAESESASGGRTRPGTRVRDPEESWRYDARDMVNNTPPPKHGGRNAVLAVLVLLALALAGYVGWQHYLYRSNLEKAAENLVWADSALQKGDIDAAAVSAQSASATLEEGKEFFTPAKLWRTLTGWTGLMPAAQSDTADMEGKIRQHLDRERTLQNFRKELEPSGRDALIRRLAEIKSVSDIPLAHAMEKAVRVTAIANLSKQSVDLTPEQALARAEEEKDVLSPSFTPVQRNEFVKEVNNFSAAQLDRLAVAVKNDLVVIAREAREGKPAALERYRELRKRLAGQTHSTLSLSLSEQAGDADTEIMRQLERLDELVSKAFAAARSSLSRPEGEDKAIDDIQAEIALDNEPSAAMSDAAVRLLDEARAQADDLLRVRTEVFSRMQSEMRRNRTYAGTRLAWSMLRTGFDDPEVRIDPSAFRFDTVKARMAFTFRGIPTEMDMAEADYENRVRARLNGYTFTAGWVMLFHKPLVWMANLAEAMQKAGVDAAKYPNWEVLEGPGGPLALSVPSVPLAAIASDSALAATTAAETPGRMAFFDGRLVPVGEMPPAGAEVRQVVEDFRRAAEKLHDGIMADESINQQLRQALKPILMGTYQKPDPQDYFDSAFCRRLVEANYLQTYINPMPMARQRELDAYRQALSKLEAGHDDFSVDFGDGTRLYAVARLEADLTGDGGSGDQDPDTGESLPRYTWRMEKADSTVFYAPMPSRSVYAFTLAAHYPGRLKTLPPGRPALTEVWHATKGKIASYKADADKAEGDADLWNLAIAEDSSGRFDPSAGEAGWSFPLHVIERNDQGDPLTLATLTGVVKSPDFTRIENKTDRRAAEDAWLDSTAKTLSTPGELGLIFHQFFRYCSDSPLPELPNLIGSHYGLSDTHQTVYQSLERRWVGRLIGDCDDLAEFFQVLTRKQGKLSHVMQLPGHAACGYVEETLDKKFRFVLLQTGPVMQFTAPTLNEAVETAYRAFDREGGISHMTTDAVPLLLRFTNEETRTPFVLSARIYGDPEYAETMIKVQSYWHEHVYSAALAVMEDMVAKDPEVGSVKELGSLYERVGMYDKSIQMRLRELDMVKDNAQAAISCLLEIAQLHIQEQDKEKALAALGEMEGRMQDMIRRDDAPEFFRAMTFRSFWAMHLSRLGQPARAWNLVRYDANMTKRQLGRVAEPVLRTMVVIYDSMCMLRDSGKRPSAAEERAMGEVKKELEEAFGRGYFKSDDSYNAIIGRYFLMGRYAVSDLGRKAGLERLLRDGPYPDGPKDQTKRQPGIRDDEWKWFRIAPQLYLAFGMEMLDRDEYPELFDPQGAKPILEDVARAVRKGAGLGSDIAGGEDEIKAELMLSFLNRDLQAFRRCMSTVKEKNYSSLYDDAAMTFGLQCGFIPPAEFPAWVEVFREFFPGTQHYFKVVYRAIDKENYDHALMMAEATAKFFPDHELLKKEADFVRRIIPGLKERKRLREAQKAPAELVVRPAA